MKTILYATDCAKKSVPELKYVHRLSKGINAELHTVHVYDLLPIVTASVRSRGVIQENFENEQHNILKKYCQKHLKKELDSVRMAYHAIKSDSISEAIVKTASKINADLVIVGIKNPFSLRGIFTENIANELMEKLHAPLLILPDYALYEKWSNILYATDFEESDIHALEHLTEFAEPFNAQIEIVHIPRQGEDYHDKKMEWFKSMVHLRIPYDNIVFSSKCAQDVESGIRQFIEKDHPEILVMMERQRETFLEKLMHKDLVKTMEYEIDIPLLVFNKKRIMRKPTEEIDERINATLAF